MQEFKFNGLDKMANTKQGIVVAIIIILITSINFYFFKDHIKTYFSAVFFILSSGFIAVSVFMLFIARFLNGEWIIKLYESCIEVYYNDDLQESIKYENMQSVMLFSSKKNRRYLRIIDNKNKKKVIQIQYFPFMKKEEIEVFDQFSLAFRTSLKTIFYENKKISKGDEVINFYKNN